MDNRELVDAANALIQWANSQTITPKELEKVMAKVQARIITDRMGVKLGSPSPSAEEWRQELLHAGETLSHELITRIYKIAGRR